MFDRIQNIQEIVGDNNIIINMDKDYITADKFNTVLMDFLADNGKAMIFRIHKIGDEYRVGQIIMRPK